VSPLIPPTATSPFSAPWKFYQFVAYKPEGARYARLNLMKRGVGFVDFDKVVVAGGPPF
jgi:hypothetical protein